MAYEHSTASGMHDLLDKLRLFLIGDGWTVNEWSDDSQMYQVWSGLTATGSKRLHIQKTLGDSGDTQVCYFNFRSATRIVLFEGGYNLSTQVNSHYWSEVRGIGLNGSTGYDASSAGSNWDDQPGRPEDPSNNKAIGACMMNLSASSIPYWFFSFPNTVIVVCEETTSGFYQWMAFGRMAGKGGYTGGMFFDASSDGYWPARMYWGNPTNPYNYRQSFMADILGTLYSGGAIWLDENSILDWRFIGRAGSSALGYADHVHPSGACPYYDPLSYGRHAWNQPIITAYTPNSVNALNVMGPIYWLCENINGRHFYCGYIEGIRCINRTVYLPGDSFVLGDSGTGDEWVVFPAHAQGDASTDPFYPSANNFYPQYGFAVKKVL